MKRLILKAVVVIAGNLPAGQAGTGRPEESRQPVLNNNSIINNRNRKAVFLPVFSPSRQKTFFNPLLISFFLTILAANSYAQYPRVDIPGSEIRKITSSIVAGQEYELQIFLPGGHRNSTKKFPVVYLMDSQWDFPLIKSLYGQHYYDGFIPEIIVVGVTWGGTRPNPDSLRVRDYTPTKEARQPQSGGADKFLSFMKDELFPFIESNYKADGNNRTLMGCSLGGLITLYALFTHTEMFNGYVAASPAYGWDREVIYQYEKTFFDKKPATAARLYMTMGDVERGKPGFDRLAKHLADRNYTSLKIRSKVLENTGHSGTKAEGFSRGLQYVYEKPELTLDASVLNKYAGQYELPNGNKIELKNEGGKLALYFNANNKFDLFAASETEFYAKSEFLKMYFTPGNDKVDGFRLEQYGNTRFFKKTN